MMRPVRGTKDLYPKDFSLFKKIVEVAINNGKLFGFEEISTPIIEYANIFDRSLGDTSDVVSKEMYTFLDRGGEAITLRPEFTAAIIRSIISESKTHDFPLRLSTYGPIFRYERPQAGRQRQFHQINFEIFGEKSLSADVDTILLASKILKDLGLSDKVKLELNSLGCSESRNNYHSKLVEYFLQYESDLSEDSLKRLHKNPLRILDSKDETDKKINQSAPKMSQFYTKESYERFDKLKEQLNYLDVSFEVNESLVRGLDYYCHTAFEFTTKELGAQGTVIGGGRYDSLAKMMSAKHDFSGIGFGGGIERLMLMMKDNNHYESKKICILPITDSEIEFAHKISQNLRNNNIPSIILDSGKIPKRIEKAVSKGCIGSIFVGNDEIKKSLFELKNLENGTKIKVTLEDLPSKCFKIL